MFSLKLMNIQIRYFHNLPYFGLDSYVIALFRNKVNDPRAISNRDRGNSVSISLDFPGIFH